MAGPAGGALGDEQPARGSGDGASGVPAAPAHRQKLCSLFRSGQLEPVPWLGCGTAARHGDVTLDRAVGAGGLRRHWRPRPLRA